MLIQIINFNYMISRWKSFIVRNFAVVCKIGKPFMRIYRKMCNIYKEKMLRACQFCFCSTSLISTDYQSWLVHREGKRFRVYLTWNTRPWPPIYAINYS